MISKKKNFFSIIEMLTIISIIAVLMGILFPLLIRSKMKGKYTRWTAHKNSLKADDGCILYYDFGEGADETLENIALSIGRKGYKREKLNGVINNGSWTEGRWPMKNALLFNKTNPTYVTAPYQKTIKRFSELSVMGWVRADALTGTQYIIGKWWSSGNYRSWGLYLTGNNIRWRATNNGKDSGIQNYIQTDYRAYEEEWTHIAAIYDGANLSLYINNRQVGTAAQNSIYSTTKPIFIGGGEDGDNYCFDGAIDEMIVFKRAISAADIKSHYEMGKQ